MKISLSSVWDPALCNREIENAIGQKIFGSALSYDTADGERAIERALGKGRVFSVYAVLDPALARGQIETAVGAGGAIADTRVISVAATPSTYLGSSLAGCFRSVIPLVANPDTYVRVVVVGGVTSIGHMSIGVWDADATHTNTVATPVLLSFGGVSSGYPIGNENFASDWVTAASLGTFTSSNRLVVVADTSVASQFNHVASAPPAGALGSLVNGVATYNVAAPNHAVGAGLGYGAVISIETAPAGIVTGPPINLDNSGSGAEGYHARNLIPCGVNALSQLRVRLSSFGTSIFQTDHVSIGLWNGTATDCTATPIELKFGGNSGFTVTGPLSAVSDWTSFAGFSSTNNFVIIFDVSSVNGNFPYTTTNGLTASYQNASGPQWNIRAPGLAASFGGTIAVSQIEFR